MQSADKGAPPPPSLQLKWYCGDSKLPEAGGVLDQNARLMSEMTVLNNVYRVVQKLRNMYGKSIHQLTDNERRMIKGLREMGLL